MMTVENLLSLLVSNPPPRHNMGFEMSHDQDVSASRIAIPSRTRHASIGSTGSSYGSGSSPPGSPPLQDYIAFHMSTLQLGQHSSKKLDRSTSLPLTESQNSTKNVNPTRYKTELCRPFEESGYCKYGEKCQFAHGDLEQRSMSRHPKYKTELCRTYHTVGFCPYGPRCHFIHDEDELKLCQINQLKHQQLLQQVAQQVAQQQHVLSHVVLQQQQQTGFPPQKGPVTLGAPILTPQQCTLPHASSLDYSSLSVAMALGSTADSPPASISSNSPSLSPTSMLSDDVFSGIPTPPPGFSALPPPPRAPPAFGRALNYSDLLQVSGMMHVANNARNNAQLPPSLHGHPVNLVPMLAPVSECVPVAERAQITPLPERAQISCQMSEAKKRSSATSTTSVSNEVFRCTPPSSPQTMVDGALDALRLPIFNTFRQK